MEMGIDLQKIPKPSSQITQDNLEQTETIYRDVQKIAMQVYIKHKAYYVKKANASKLKERDYVYVIYLYADLHGRKIPFTENQWTGPYNVEEVLPNNNYLVRKIGTGKTQVLHRMRLRQSTSRQPTPDVESTPQDWFSDPEVIIQYADLYARAWESKYEKPKFDNAHNNTPLPNSTEFVGRYEPANEKTITIPGTIQENPQEIFAQADRSCDGTDTDH